MYSKYNHTFVVCAYGESPYLIDCVESLLNQSIQSNVIISTSTPNDLIASVADRYGLPLFINEGAAGIAHDWNCAVNHCPTELITIAHQDDVYSCSYVESMLERVNQSRKPLIFFTDYEELRDGSVCSSSLLLNIKRILLFPLKSKQLSSKKFVKRLSLSFGSSICCPSVTLVLPNLKTPIFKEGFKSNLDWEAWEQISQLDGDFCYCSEKLTRHRIHSGSETSALIKDNTRTTEDYLMLRKFWPDKIARLINVLYSKGQNSNTL